MVSCNLDRWSEKGKLSCIGDTGWVDSGSWHIPSNAPLGEYIVRMAAANTNIHNHNKKELLNIVEDTFTVT